MAYTMRTEPDTRLLLCNSNAAQSTMYPGRMRAILLCAMAEKQNTGCPLWYIEPKPRDVKAMRTAASTSKTCENCSDRGTTTNCRNPSEQPKTNDGPKSAGREEKANGPTCGR
jgi:hypothetical protein